MQSSQPKKNSVRCSHCGVTPDDYGTLKTPVSTGGTKRVAKESTYFFFTCNRCGKVFCPDHRLPEKHNCVGIHKENKFIKSSKKYDEMHGKQKSKSGIQATRCFRCGVLQKENEYFTKCELCGQRFCFIHALPEDHDCIGIDTFQTGAFPTKTKLRNQKSQYSIASKIILLLIIIALFYICYMALL